jgi:NAD+ synthase
MQKSKSKGFICGVSGGIDSSVTSLLLKKTYKPYLLLIMPCDSETIKTQNTIKFCQKNNLKYKVVDLTPIFRH